MEQIPYLGLTDIHHHLKVVTWATWHSRFVQPWLENINCIEMAHKHLEISWLITCCNLNGFLKFELSTGTPVSINLRLVTPTTT
jgi:hypothetical protein